MARFYQLLVKAQGDTKPAAKAMRDLRKSSRNLKQAIGVDFGKIAKVTGAALGVGLAASVKVGVDEMLEAQRVTAQTNAVIKSTGGAANVSASQLAKLAGSLSDVSGVDDELIQSGANVLMTFTNVRNAAGKNNDIFNQATQVALDMSTALGQDLKSSNIQLGKALNDPIKGITALSRVGVSFTKEQKNMIDEMMDAGNVMGAQKIILAELNKEFGGSAAAAGGTASGAINRLKNSYAEMSATIVQAVTPSLAGMASRMNDLVKRIDNWAKSKAGQEALASLRSGLESGARAVAAIAERIGSFIGVLYRFRAVTVPLGIALASLVVTIKAYRIASAAAQYAQDLWGARVVVSEKATKLYNAALKALKFTMTAVKKAASLLKTAIGGLKWLIQKAGVVAYRAALVALRIAMVAYRGAVVVATVATRALTLAMRANPIGLIVTLIIAAGVAFVALYKKSDRFRALVQKLGAVFRLLGAAAKAVFAAIVQKMQPVISIIRKIASVYIKGVILYFRTLGAVASAVWSGIKAAWGRASDLFGRVKKALNFSSAFSAIKDGFRAAINGVISLWNRLEFGIPGLPGRFKKHFDGVSIKTPNIPLLAEGGTIRSPGSVIVGEAGPELLSLPRGAQVTPLSRAGGNTYNVTVNAPGPVDTIAFMRSLRTAARMGTV